MRTSRSTLTAVFAIVVFALSLFGEFKDGGNLDFYFKPLIWTWLAVTALSLVFPGKHRALLFVRDQGWLQLVVPIIFLVLSATLVGIYMPHIPSSPASRPIPSR
jgi:hypothetical protein